ncbi:sulfite exporter TauE/SafE family protein [Niveispirillum irakense]|uniref:sulfite exporter TauE/SafE family protein n=1 Tax=Niveispirillum irakense TaxID=34011 RepID=UPI000419DA7C|nr:sulfite exporter TauE/SafE family protein [Niveispirillum irakense]
MPDLAALAVHLPTLGQAIGLLLVALVAGIIRGLTGFGAALIIVPCLSLFLSPAEAVPTSVAAIATTNLPLLRGAVKEGDRRMVLLFLAGCLPTIPLGVYLLASLPPDLVRRAIGICVIIAALLLLNRRFRLTRPGWGLKMAAGGIGGFLNGAVGMGGPPVILTVLAMPLSPLTARATLILYFTGLNLLSIASLWWQGLFSPHTLIWSLLMIPPLVGAARLGELWFRRNGGSQFRPIAIGLLVITGIVALLRP